MRTEEERKALGLYAATAITQYREYHLYSKIDNDIYTW